MNTGFSFLEGRSFVIGRGGQINIDDPSVSRAHAEIIFVDGKIKLRDLCSTNGTYIVEGKNCIRFGEGFVIPNQRIVVGNKSYTIRYLLATIGIFASSSDQTDLTIKLAKPTKKLHAASFGA